jgi:hypothetical protein
VIGFLAPWALLGLALLPLYALWFRRPSAARETPDATVFLWQAAAKQPPANKMKIPWRLLLHLTLLATLVLAWARPQLDATTRQDTVVLLALNLSLNAEDGASAPAAQDLAQTEPVTRFEVAQAVVQGLQQRHGRVQLLDAATLAPLSAELQSAQDVAAAFANLRPTVRHNAAVQPDPARLASLTNEASVHWLADRPPPPGARVTVHNLAGRGRNAGIVAAHASEGGIWFNLLSTYRTPQSVTVRAYPLTRAGTADRAAPPLASVTLTAPAEGQAAGRLEGLNREPVALVLTPPTGDALPLDDVAFADPRPLQVRLDRPAPAVQRALQATGRVEVRIARNAASQTTELRVLHGRSAPSAPGLTLRLPAPAEPAKAGRGLPHVSDDPLVTGLIFTGVRLAVRDGDGVEPPAGARTLVRAQAGEAPPQPLVTRTSGLQGDVIDLGAVLGRGDLINRSVFPAFIGRVVREADEGRQQPFGRLGATPAESLTPRVERSRGTPALYHLVHPATTRLPEPDAFPPTDALRSQPRTQNTTDLTPWLILVALALLLSEAGLRVKDARASSRPQG